LADGDEAGSNEREKTAAVEPRPALFPGHAVQPVEEIAVVPPLIRRQGTVYLHPGVYQLHGYAHHTRCTSRQAGHENLIQQVARFVHLQLALFVQVKPKRGVRQLSQQLGTQTVVKGKET